MLALLFLTFVARPACCLGWSPAFLCKLVAATGSNLVEEHASLSGSQPRAAVIQEPAIFLDDCQLLIQIAVAFPVANPVAFPVANSTSFGARSENWFSLRARQQIKHMQIDSNSRAQAEPVFAANAEGS